MKHNFGQMLDIISFRCWRRRICLKESTLRILTAWREVVRCILCCDFCQYRVETLSLTSTVSPHTSILPTLTLRINYNPLLNLTATLRISLIDQRNANPLTKISIFLPPPTLPYPTTTHRIKPYHHLPYQTLPPPTVPYPTTTHPTTPYHHPPYQTLPPPTVPNPTTTHRTIPYHYPPYQTLPPPTLPPPTLPNPTTPSYFILQFSFIESGNL